MPTSSAMPPMPCTRRVRQNPFLRRAERRHSSDCRQRAGTAPDDVWFAGSRGTLLHYDGKELRAIDTQVPNALIAVWGVERNVAWVVPLNAAPLRVRVNAAGESEVAPVPGDVWPGTKEKVGRGRAIGGSKDAVWLVGDPADYPDDWVLNQNIRQLVTDEDGGATWRSPLTHGRPFDRGGPQLRAIYSFGATSAWAMGLGEAFRLRRGEMRGEMRAPSRGRRICFQGRRPSKVSGGRMRTTPGPSARTAPSSTSARRASHAGSSRRRSSP